VYNLGWCIDEKKQLVNWIERGGNVLWVLEPDVSIDAKTKSIARAFGRVLDDKPSLVHDYFSNKDGDSSWIKCQSKQSSIFPGTFAKGVGHRLDKTNPLVFPILIASATASQSGSTTGKDNVMVSGLTARNGARILVAGSVDCLNEKLVTWTFNHSHSLRIDSFTPKILSKEVDFFRIRDNIEVEICLSQRKGDAWGPFVPDDAQIELVMMDPKIRVNLHPNEKGCLSTGPVQLPSRYGAYSLAFRYQRHGYTHLIHKEALTVYPYLYDQSPRWTSDLFPYYGAWISQMTASLLVLFPMLLHSSLQVRSKF